MLYRKNLAVWERWLRGLIAVALVGGGLLASPSMLSTIIALTIAVGILITSVFGYCPACAVVGRKPQHQDTFKH